MTDTNSSELSTKLPRLETSEDTTIKMVKLDSTTVTNESIPMNIESSSPGTAKITTDSGPASKEEQNLPTGSPNNAVNSNLSEELCIKIRNQIEYYFGNYNLPRDKFLSEQIKADNGWVSMEVMLKFRRLSDLSTDCENIFKALKLSQIIEIDEKDKKIRRTPKLPLPNITDEIREETVKRTIYCKGFPRDGSITLDNLLDFFKVYGPYETVHMRNFFDKVTNKSGFKGSVLVVFPNLEKAQEFMKHDDVQFKKMPILRKWYADYRESKRLEFEERKARKEARSKMLEEEGEKAKAVDPLPKGTFIHLAGLVVNTSRDVIKSSLLDIIDDVAFIDVPVGSTEAYIRLSTRDSNKQAVTALEGKLKINGAEITVRVVEGEEEEEQIKKAQLAKSRAMSGDHKRKRSFRGSGRGSGRGKRGFAKRRKF